MGNRGTGCTGYVFTVCWVITFITCRELPRIHREMILCGDKIKLSPAVGDRSQVTALVSNPFLDVSLGIVPQVEYTVTLYWSKLISKIKNAILTTPESGGFYILRDGTIICGTFNHTARTSAADDFSIKWTPILRPEHNSTISLIILWSKSLQEWKTHAIYYNWRTCLHVVRIVQGIVISTNIPKFMFLCSYFDILLQSPEETHQLFQFQNLNVTEMTEIKIFLHSENHSDLIINSKNFNKYLYRWFQSSQRLSLIRFNSCAACTFIIAISTLDYRNGCNAFFNTSQGTIQDLEILPMQMCEFQINSPEPEKKVYLYLPENKLHNSKQCKDNYITVSPTEKGNITLCSNREDIHLVSVGTSLSVNLFSSNRNLAMTYKSIRTCKNLTVSQETGNVCGAGYYGNCFYIINVPLGYNIDLDFIYLEISPSDFEDCRHNYIQVHGAEEEIIFCGNWTRRTNKFRSVNNSLLLEMKIHNPITAGKGFCATYRVTITNSTLTACNYGWISGPFYCYRVFLSPADWTSSSDICQNYGGHLASISDENIKNLIDDMLSTNVYLDPTQAFWIGANDLTYENCYEWSDGQPFEYTNWFPGWKQYNGYNSQPSDDGLSNQDCIELRKNYRYPSKGVGVTNSYYWNDRDCEVANAFICQKPRLGVSVPTYVKPKCNRTINLSVIRDRDVITSPEYPGNYLANLECYVEVLAPPGRRIDLHFSDFLLEDHKTCQYDYLEIQDGVNTLEIRYCGDWRSRIKLLRRITNTNYLRLTFSSDYSHNYLGFKAEVSLKPEENPDALCENKLFRRHQHYCYLLATYPEVSWDTANRICTEMQSQLAVITNAEEKRFVHSLIQSAEGYMSGVIYWIGARRGADERQWNWLITSEKIPPDILNVDDSSIQNQPLCLSIQWRHHNATSDLFWSGKRCNHSGRYICKKLAFVMPEKLNVTFTNREGQLTSINYPAHYINDMHYVVTIKTEVGLRIVLMIEHLEIEWQEDCLYDYLEMTSDLEKNGTKLCGTAADARSNHVSNQETLYLVFHSDYSITGSGFVVKWESVATDDCEGFLMSTSHYITSPRYPNRYLPGVDCTTILSAAPKEKILLTFSHFDVSRRDADGKCSRDSLTVSLDHDNHFLLCGNYSSVPNGFTLLSYSENITLHFHTSAGSALGNTGFNLTWEPWNKSDVEMILNLEESAEAEVQSLNYPLETPVDVNISQYLNAPFGYQLKIGLHDGHHKSISCVGRKLKIVDPYSQKESVICPKQKLHRNISSTLNIIKVVSSATRYQSTAKYKILYRIEKDPDYIEKTLKIHSIHSCFPNPCQNEGRCIHKKRKPKCDCVGFYTGIFCHLTWCDLTPCGERGQCHNTTSGYRCNCLPGYTGNQCEDLITPCSSNPCGINGKCSSINETYKCFCQLWYEGHNCEKYVLRIPYKPLSQRMLKEPFWLGLITVFAVLLVILCVYCIKRKFAEKIERLLAEEIEKSKCNPSPPATRYSLSSNQLSLTPGNQSPPCSKSFFTKLRKYSIRSNTSGVSPSDREQSRTFSFDDILRKATKKSSASSADTSKKDDEKSRILASLVTSPTTRRMSLDEFIRMSEMKLQATNRDEQKEEEEAGASEPEKVKETSFNGLLSPRFARHSAPSFTEFHSIREQSVEYASSTDEDDPKISEVQADISPSPQEVKDTGEKPTEPSVFDEKEVLSPPPISQKGLLEVPSVLPAIVTSEVSDTEIMIESPCNIAEKKPDFLLGRKYSIDLPVPKILVTSNTGSIESDPNSPPRTPNPAKSMTYLTPLTADRTISESNLSTSGYSSLSSPGLSRCNSSSPISDELEGQDSVIRKHSPPHKTCHAHAKCHQSSAATVAQASEGQHQYKTRTFTNAMWRTPNRKPCHHERCRRFSYQTSTDESIDDEGIGMDPIDFKIRKGEVKSARELEAYMAKKAPMKTMTSSSDTSNSMPTKSSPNVRKGEKTKKVSSKSKKSPLASPTSTPLVEITTEGGAKIIPSSDSDQETYQRPKAQTRRAKKDGASSPRIIDGRRSASTEKLVSRQAKSNVHRCNSSTSIPYVISDINDLIFAQETKRIPSIQRPTIEKGRVVNDSIESSVPSDTDEEKCLDPLLPTTEGLQPTSSLRRQEAVAEESDSGDSSSETTVLLKKDRLSLPDVEETGTQTDLTSAIVVYTDEGVLSVS